MNLYDNIGLRGLALVAALLIPIACSGSSDEANCTDLCSEAQDKNCTVITGDCGQFCGAAINLDERSGCQSKREAYQSCLNDKEDVCDGCSAAESAITDCLGAYCIANISDPDCQAILSN